MTKSIKRKTIGMTVIVFILVNTFVLWNVVEKQRKDVENHKTEDFYEDWIPILKYGEGAFWNGKDINGEPITIPDSTLTSLIVGIDLSSGHQTLERVRILSTAFRNEKRHNPLLILAAKGSSIEQRTLRRICGGFARVVDRNALHDILGYDPSGGVRWELMLVDSDGEIGFSLSRANTHELKVLLVQRFGWRWNE